MLILLLFNSNKCVFIITFSILRPNTIVFTFPHVRWSQKLLYFPSRTLAEPKNCCIFLPAGSLKPKTVVFSFPHVRGDQKLQYFPSRTFAEAKNICIYLPARWLRPKTIVFSFPTMSGTKKQLFWKAKKHYNTLHTHSCEKRHLITTGSLYDFHQKKIRIGLSGMLYSTSKNDCFG